MKKFVSLLISTAAVFACVTACQKTSQNDAPPFEGVISTDATVDLGLSVLWSGFNLGAETPEQYGDFYAWSETETKDDYSRETYSYYDGNRGYNLDKGCDALKDVAYEKNGTGWSVPTPENFKELVDNCTVVRASYKGVTGWAVTSNVAGFEKVSIFFPAAGYKGGAFHNYPGVQGLYFSSRLIPGTNCFAQNVFFQNNAIILNDGTYGSGVDVWCGFPVRPVKSK